MGIGMLVLNIKSLHVVSTVISKTTHKPPRPKNVSARNTTTQKLITRNTTTQKFIYKKYHEPKIEIYKNCN